MEREVRMGVERVLRSRWLNRALIVFGLSCLGYYGHETIEARHVQREQIAAFEASLGAPSAPSAPSALDAPGAPSAPSAPGEALALLEIPRLGMSTAVLPGDNRATLDVAIGHLSDTPKPWEPGNSALAAHRDGLFRSLRLVRIGDRVRVRTRHGDFTYIVRETKVVQPDDLSVLAPTSTKTLTLITCYPFNFVGHAPQRFIVHAEIETGRATETPRTQR
jgi:sortase A